MHFRIEISRRAAAADCFHGPAEAGNIDDLTRQNTTTLSGADTQDPYA